MARINNNQLQPLPAITRTACVLSLAIVGLFLLGGPEAEAQHFKVLYTFTGGGDGSNPVAGLTIDAAGNLYGTTDYGGIHVGSAGAGIVFKLVPGRSHSTLEPIYEFHGGLDGSNPWAGVVFGPDGNLYGTTTYPLVPGPTVTDLGTVFELSVPPCTTCTWTKKILHRFVEIEDGANPGYGDITFDSTGNIYGTTLYGGDTEGTCNDPSGCGVVYQLSQSFGEWTEIVLHRFNGSDGWEPLGGAIFDSQGNLYGVTEYGGLYHSGNAYELSPSPSGWVERASYSFTAYPSGALTIDTAGNLYGVLGCYVYELSRPDQNWMLRVLYDLGSCNYLNANGPLVMDAAGNLYGTTENGGTGGGNVFKLTPSPSGWTYTNLHDFQGPDGASPFSGVTLDANGNIYGTTTFGGDLSGCDPPAGCGVVWEITPN